MTYVTVDVDLGEFSDAEIEAEYNERGLGATCTDKDKAEAELEKAYLLHHDGKRDQAYEILWRMCLERLNKVV